MRFRICIRSGSWGEGFDLNLPAACVVGSPWGLEGDRDSCYSLPTDKSLGLLVGSFNITLNPKPSFVVGLISGMYTNMVQWALKANATGQFTCGFGSWLLSCPHILGMCLACKITCLYTRKNLQDPLVESQNVNSKL